MYARAVEDLLLDGRYLLSFDGRVLECFGKGSHRYHLRELRPLELSEPKKNGRRTLEIASDWGGAMEVYGVAPEELEAATAFVSHVNAALAAD
jgi:hypothetical protein